MNKTQKTVKDLKPFQSGVVVALETTGALRRRIIDMGITPGATITLRRVAPFGDPLEVNVRGYELSLRKSDAEKIVIDISDGGDL